MGRRLLWAAAQLAEAVDYYAGLHERDTNASGDIAGRLAPTLALVQAAIGGPAQNLTAGTRREAGG